MRRSHTFTRTLLAAWMLSAALGSGGCRRAQTGPDAAPPTYHRFYSIPPAAVAQARGTLKGDFDWAAGASTLDDAAARWAEFLRAHEPPNGEFEDSFQQNHVRAAQYELMRVQYLRGNAAEGDKLLTKVEDVLKSQ
jgi:hypothetical protein